jgi:hypothetical protein
MEPPGHLERLEGLKDLEQLKRIALYFSYSLCPQRRNRRIPASSWRGSFLPGQLLTTEIIDLMFLYLSAEFTAEINH